jgi:N-acetylglucosamine kinase-like BadF-type ATPase
MIIADSGSTKTTWRIAKDNAAFSDVSTEGINPYFQSQEDIEQIIYTQLLPNIEPAWMGNTAEINFYGAGCSSPEKSGIVENAIKNCFQASMVQVNHDLLASARALLGKNKGIACILGTGSNSCVYDGNDITENIPSWGYLFGDFGSGAHIGKSLVQAYANDELDAELRKKLETQGVQREVVLNNAYKRPLPNRYLAGFAKLAHAHIQHPQIKKIVENCFHDFFLQQIEKYTDYKSYEVSFVGSIAFHFAEQLKQAASDRGIRMGSVLKEPISGLTNYHFS